MSHNITVDWIFIESKQSKGFDYSTCGFDKRVLRMSCNALFSTLRVFDYQFIIIYDTGSMVRKICTNLIWLMEKFSMKRRPILITGYPGVVFSEVNTGFTNRSMADYILFSCNYELQLYKEFCEKYRLKFNGLLWGWNLNIINKDIKDKDIIIFADQDVIPHGLTDRKYLVKRLIDLANAYPDTEVIIKARTKSGEKRLFNAKWPLDILINNEFKHIKPHNLKIKYGDIDQYLQRAKLLVTISSTVAIQSIMSNIATAIISDFGVNDRNGTDYYRDSGCLITFSELIEGNSVTPNNEWISTHISNDGNARNMVISQLINSVELLSKKTITDNYEKLYSIEYLKYIAENNNQSNIFKRIFRSILKFRR